MGSGTFNTRTYYANASGYATKNRTELFHQSNLADEFNPLKVSMRESCASAEHPDPTSIIIACDVTGSMGKIPEVLLKGGLGKVMESLGRIKSISNPQVMFAAIGDTEYDKAPLQVTQFESDNRIEAQLKKLYLEGGGGGNDIESYHVIWYFAARKTKLDSLQTGKKGILFTMGDELVPNVLRADHIRKFIDKDYTGTDILTSQLVKEVTEKYEVFHLLVQDTDTYKRLMAKGIHTCWQQYLGERAINVAVHTEIPEKIVATVQSLCELTPQRKEAVQANSVPAVDGVVDQLKGLGLFAAAKPANPSNSNSSAVLNKDSDDIPFLFKCPISQEVMDDPVMAEDGFTYERREIAKWLENHNTSPKANTIIGKLLIPNNDLKSEIIRWKESQASRSACAM